MSKANITGFEPKPEEFAEAADRYYANVKGEQKQFDKVSEAIDAGDVDAIRLEFRVYNMLRSVLHDSGMIYRAHMRHSSACGKHMDESKIAAMNREIAGEWAIRLAQISEEFTFEEFQLFHDMSMNKGSYSAVARARKERGDKRNHKQQVKRDYDALLLAHPEWESTIQSSGGKLKARNVEYVENLEWVRESNGRVNHGNYGNDYTRRDV
jgi:hypothetical protein